MALQRGSKTPLEGVDNDVNNHNHPHLTNGKTSKRGNASSWSDTIGQLRTKSLFGVIALLTTVVVLQTRIMISQTNKLTGRLSSSKQQAVNYASITSLRLQANNQNPCRWYMAESAIAPNGGLGMFAGVGVYKNEPVGIPDICIFVGDAPGKWTHLRSHSFGGGTFFGQYEGDNSRAACEGFTTTFNTVPNELVNTELGTPVLPTHAGTHRAISPGAGSITHHFGIQHKAKQIITAGAELTIDYGDWDFSEEDREYFKPERPVSWLEQYGWCVDNIAIGTSTVPHAGRGAFAKRPLARGTVVAPAPLQCFQDRAVFSANHPNHMEDPEQLFVNYCFQHPTSKMMFYPYGVGVNLINHAQGRQANLRVQWSPSSMSHSSWLDLSYEQFWDVTYPGGLIIEFVATRDIQEGEELFFDYGPDWDRAWKEHTKSWRPPRDAADYVYPQEIDETEPLRTVYEQQTNPYAKNLATMCYTNDWDRVNGNDQEWSEPNYSWWWVMAYCHVMEREVGTNGDYVYTVWLTYEYGDFDDNVPIADRAIDRKVPRHAIRFMEKPYADDEHLHSAFRHPIGVPDYMFPEQWKYVEPPLDEKEDEEEQKDGKKEKEDEDSGTNNGDGGEETQGSEEVEA